MIISTCTSKKYFKENHKLRLTGNPIRLTLKLTDRSEAIKHYSLQENKKTLLILGGSLGARSINRTIADNINLFTDRGLQLIWQTGERYYDEYMKYENSMVKVMPFINDMGLAYSASDLIVARAGATTVAEIAHLGLAVIFIPSPNVAADHQYKNALSIHEMGGSLLIKDSEIENGLGDLVTESICNDDLLRNLRSKIKEFSKPHAAKEIAEDIMSLAEGSK